MEGEAGERQNAKNTAVRPRRFADSDGRWFELNGSLHNCCGPCFIRIAQSRLLVLGRLTRKVHFSCVGAFGCQSGGFGAVVLIMILGSGSSDVQMDL